MSKTSILRSHIAKREYKSALRIAKTFRIGISKEDQRTLQYAYECLVFPDQYRQLGRDVEAAISQGIQLLLNIYACPMTKL